MLSLVYIAACKVLPFGTPSVGLPFWSYTAPGRIIRCSSYHTICESKAGVLTACCQIYVGLELQSIIRKEVEWELGCPDSNLYAATRGKLEGLGSIEGILDC